MSEQTGSLTAVVAELEDRLRDAEKRGGPVNLTHKHARQIIAMIDLLAGCTPTNVEAQTHG